MKLLRTPVPYQQKHMFLKQDTAMFLPQYYHATSLQTLLTAMTAACKGTLWIWTADDLLWIMGRLAKAIAVPHLLSSSMKLAVPPRQHSEIRAIAATHITSNWNISCQASVQHLNNRALMWS